MPRLLTRVGPLALTAVLTMPALALMVPGSAAAAMPNYDAFAKATSFELSVANESIPALPALVGGGPEADTHQTSGGIGDANAATPYAGDTVPTLPGAAGGLFGFPVPPYPFIASSTKGGPAVRASYPGVELRAESRDLTTDARATVGSDGSGMTSLCRIEQDSSGSVQARSDVEIAKLLIGQVLSLSGVQSFAEVKADAATGELERTSSTVIDALTVPGLVLSVPKSSPATIPVPVPVPGVPNIPPIDAPPLPVPAGGTVLREPQIGLRDGSFTVTLPSDTGPQTFALPAQPVLDALAATGIKVAFTPPQMTANGIVSGAYTFSYTAAAPPDNAIASGTTAITQTTGSTTASVNLKPVVTPLSPGQADGIAPLTGADGVAAPGVVPLPDAAGLALPGAVSGGATPDLTGTQNVTSPYQLAVLSGTDGMSIQNLYLAIVVLAGVAFVGATTLSLMGVRFLWSS
jgi:hypothetical protein